jgi:mRNA interferase RelE/StbE
VAETFRVEWSRDAAKEILRIDKRDAERIIAATESLASQPRPQQSTELRGFDGLRRLRVGDYRVIYHVREERLIVLVISVGHRRDVYSKIRR